MGPKKDELLEKGLMKIQYPVNFDKIKKVGIYNPKRSGIAFIDLTISVIDSGFLVQIQDITEEKQAKDAEKRLGALMDNNPSLVFMKDEDGKYVYLNKSYEKQFVHSKNWYGKTDFDFWSKESAELFWANDARVLKSGKIHQFLEDSTDCNGTRHVWLNYKFPFTDSKNERYVGGIGIDATDQICAEEALKESEELFSKTFHANPAPMAINTLDGMFIDVNESYEKLTGYSRDELIGSISKDLNLINPEERKNNLTKFKEKCSIKDVELEITTKSGKKRDVIISAESIKINGEIRIISFVYDITERKKSEEHFRKEVERESFLLELYKKAPQLTDEELYRRALDHTVSLTDSTIGFFHKISDDQKNIILTAWNNEAWNNCKASFKNHYPIEESGNWTDCIQAKRPIVYNDYENSPNRKGFPKGHTPVKRFISTPVFDGDKVKFIFGVGNKIEEYDDHDVIQIQSVANELYRIIKQRHSAQALKEAHDNLEKKVKKRTYELEKAYESLKESEEKFRLIFDEAEDSIVLNEMMENGLPGKIIEVNEATSKRLGYTKEELLNMTPKEIIAPEKLVEMRKNAEQIKKKGHAIFEIVHMTKDGRRIPVEVSNHLIEFKGKKAALTVVRDIKQRKEMEKQLKETINELKETLNELERSNKELEQFAYVSSHDLQEPLRTIASFTQLLERRYKGQFDSDADEFMDYIVEAAKRMKEQINGLLEYSRVATKGEEFQLVDMNSILNQTLQTLNTLIKESKAEITIDELPNVMGDTRQLQSVFQNLISNAIKFRKCEEPPIIHISSYKDENNNEYVFSIKDNGIGIEEQYMERIFTIFQRLHTREVYKGTGIGLSIVKRIIERHNGRIWVESEYGVGSTFYFTIPI